MLKSSQIKMVAHVDDGKFMEDSNNGNKCKAKTYDKEMWCFGKNLVYIL